MGDINKGRFKATVRTIDELVNDSRSPFEGELGRDDDGHIYVFNSDATGAYRNTSATKRQEEYLSSISDDIDGSKAMVETGLVKRFFYNVSTKLAWLSTDELFLTDIIKYYSVIDCKKDHLGKNNPIFLRADSLKDGIEDYIIPIGDQGVITSKIYAKKWYKVNFYNEDKVLMMSELFLSTPVTSIRISTTEDSKTVSKIGVKFDQEYKYPGDNVKSCYLYKGQDKNALLPKLILTYLDGHTRIIEGYKRFEKYTFTPEENTTLKALVDTIGEFEEFTFKYWTLDKKTPLTEEDLNGTIVRSLEHVEIYGYYEFTPYLDGTISFEGLDELDENLLSEGRPQNFSVKYNHISTPKTSMCFKTHSQTVPFLGQESVDVFVDTSQDFWNTREYLSVEVRPIGNKNSTTVEDFTITKGEDGYDTIHIPSNYFELGNCKVDVKYKEENRNPLVNVHPLVFTFAVHVYVIPDVYDDIVKILPCVTTDVNGMHFRYFGVYESGILREITNEVEYLSEVDPTKYNETQNVSIKVPVSHKKNAYKEYEFSVYCDDPRIVGNNGWVKINNAPARALNYSTQDKKFTPCVYNGSRYVAVGTQDLFSLGAAQLNGRIPTMIRIRGVEKFDLSYTDMEESIDSLSYDKPIYVPNTFFVNDSGVTIGDLINQISSVPPQAYRPSFFSLSDGGDAITDEERDVELPVGKRIDIYVAYIRDPNHYSIVSNKPMLVEFFAKEERDDGSIRYVETGALVHYCAQNLL